MAQCLIILVNLIECYTALLYNALIYTISRMWCGAGGSNVLLFFYNNNKTTRILVSATTTSYTTDDDGRTKTADNVVKKVL